MEPTASGTVMNVFTRVEWIANTTQFMGRKASGRVVAEHQLRTIREALQRAVDYSRVNPIHLFTTSYKHFSIHYITR